MKPKLLLNLIIFVMLPLSVFAVTRAQNQLKNANANKTKAIKETETDDPYIKHLRVALNGYLTGTNEGIDLKEFVIKEGKTDKGQVLGLASFDVNYFKSNFTVLKIVDGPSYGQIITLYFDDKPDKIFDAWIYRMENGFYDLRGFWENSKSAK